MVNVGSAAGLRVLPPDPAYAFTKAGLLHFTRSVAAGERAGANIVLPGMVRTPLLTPAAATASPTGWSPASPGRCSPPSR